MMKNSDELKDELENSPFLKKMKEQPGEGFKVPKHYFERLPDEIWKQVKPVPAPVPSRPNWLAQIELFLQGLRQPHYALALTSVVLLVVADVVFFKDRNAMPAPQPIAEVRLEDISDEELFTYVSSNIGDFDHRLVLEASAPEVLETVQPKTRIFKAEVAKPDVEEMEEYLDEVIDEVDLEDLEKLL